MFLFYVYCSKKVGLGSMDIVSPSPHLYPSYLSQPSLSSQIFMFLMCRPICFAGLDPSHVGYWEDITASNCTYEHAYLQKLFKVCDVRVLALREAVSRCCNSCFRLLEAGICSCQIAVGHCHDGGCLRTCRVRLCRLGKQPSQARLFHSFGCFLELGSMTALHC